MPIDFFRVQCQRPTRETRFGLFDAEDNTPAKILYADEPSWNATVLNNDQKEILFTAIDNCIDIWRNQNEMESRCDAMMTYESNLLFIELKNRRNTWQEEGLSQIESTIKGMIEEQNVFYYSFNKRKAIVANARHQFPHFQNNNLEQREYFMREYKARIQFEAQIVIE